MKRGKSSEAGDGVVRLIDGLFGRAAELGASDLHFEPTERTVEVRVRIDGRLHRIESIPAELLPNVVTRLKVMAGLLTYRVDIPQEGGLTLGNGRGMDVRISTFPTIRGERVAVRFLPQGAAIRRLDELGLSDRLIDRLVGEAASREGLILVTGPAGSGKTTTLYALLRHLQSALPGACLITIEDPVEYRLDGVAQVQVTPHGELTYARALRSLLRQDPQVVLIGEIRDAETAHIVMEAALTGHLLLSTMHGGSASEAIVRLREMGVPDYQLTSSLRLVISQRLVRTLCSACGGAGPETDEGDPCPVCLGDGFRGRTACAEAASMTPALRAAILDRADTDRLRAAICETPDHATLAQDARRHVRAGRTSESEVHAAIGPARSDIAD